MNSKDYTPPAIKRLNSKFLALDLQWFNHLTYNVMKLKSLFLFVLALGLSTLSSCIKDRWISDETAADVVAKSLEQNAGGLAREVDLQTTYIALSVAAIPCGDSATVNRTFSYNANNQSASADYVWNIKKICEGSEVYLTWRVDFNGTYDFPRVKGTWQGQRNWTAVQLGSEFTAWKLNGTCSRSGTHESKVRRRQTFDSTVETVFTDVLVDKTTRRLIGGTATSLVTINSESGNTYTYNVVTTISESGVATVVINGTSTFTFNLY